MDGWGGGDLANSRMVVVGDGGMEEGVEMRG